MHKIICLISLAFFLQNCTYNISMVHTEGTASDVIDETTANTPTVTTSIRPSAI